MTIETLSMTELRQQVTAADFEGLLETVDILSNEEGVRRLAEAEEELAQSRGHSLESIRRELSNVAS